MNQKLKNSLQKQRRGKQLNPHWQKGQEWKKKILFELYFHDFMKNI